jgi:hypothetical protein
LPKYVVQHHYSSLEISESNNWQESCKNPGPHRAQLILLPLVNAQIMWYFPKSQSTLIHVNQIKVESQNNVLHIKSPFWCSLEKSKGLTTTTRAIFDYFSSIFLRCQAVWRFR